MNLYRNESSDPKHNAQRNLIGRTHYVDDDTLRCFKSRILSARDHDGGLLFSIVISDALDMHNTKRGFRFVIFDVFGTVLERPTLDETFRTSEQASKARYAALDKIDAVAHTLAAIESEAKGHALEMERARVTVREVAAKREAIAA
jgi:hypothetical protein